MFDNDLFEYLNEEVYEDFFDKADRLYDDKKDKLLENEKTSHFAEGHERNGMEKPAD